MDYQIKSGDNLTKIAKEQYGLKGDAAYKKALEIAKANNIKNPNLIFTGATLKLSDTVADKKKVKNAKPKGDTFIKSDESKDCDVANTYKKLMGEIRKFQQNDYMNKANQHLLVGEYQFDKKTIPTYEKEISFADPKIFSKDATAEEKVENYKKAALEFAQQDIDDKDKEGADGKKDGLINYEEYKAHIQNEYKERYENLYKTTARNQFIQIYVEVNGKAPCESEIQKGIENDTTLSDFYNRLYDNDDFYRQRFESSDVDGNNMIDKTEIAANVMLMDAFAQIDTKVENPLTIKGDNNEVKMMFDGIINVGDQLPEDQKSQLPGGKETIAAIHKMFFGQTYFA